MTVFHSLLSSDIPAEELEIDRLKQEATSIVGAGIETTKSALALASYYVLTNPEIGHRLRQELRDAIPNSTKIPSLSELERLPYLTAVIRECE